MNFHVVFFNQFNFAFFYQIHVEFYKVKKLHNDWDILNKRYTEKYGIVLPPEVEELNVVKYKEGKTVYINVHELDDVIEELRAEGWLKNS